MTLSRRLRASLGMPTLPAMLDNNVRGGGGGVGGDEWAMGGGPNSRRQALFAGAFAMSAHESLIRV